MMRRIGFAFFLSVIFASLLYGALLYWGRPKTSGTAIERIHRWKEFEKSGAPNVKIDDFSLAEVSAPLKIVHFWASHCGPCIEELPTLMELAKRYPNDLFIVNVSLDDREEDMKEFMKQHGLKNLHNMKFLWDDPAQGKKLWVQYGSELIPESYLLRRDLKLLKRLPGKTDWLSPEADEFFRSKLQLGER